MFEIIGNDIALLNEEDLRTLVALLCESELRRRDLAIASVTWGGDQNSSDGGLDVRVELPAAALIEGFVPRPITGFQVKKTDMPRSKILEEMRPHGILRPVIRELADKSGAYVIVSSTDSTSDSALQSRRTAMAEAVQGLPNRNALTLDFYDRTRIATWLREHPGLVLWVRRGLESLSQPGARTVPGRTSLKASVASICWTTLFECIREGKNEMMEFRRLKGSYEFATSCGTQVVWCASWGFPASEKRD